MIEAWRATPVVIGLVRSVQGEQAFLRMTAIELRRIAEQDPDLAIELRHLAQKIEAEAEDLARRDSKTGRTKSCQITPLEGERGGKCLT